VRQSGGKTVVAWAVEGDLDPEQVVPGTFEMEWPPRSGRRQAFPELDRVAWVPVAEAGPRLVVAQRAFVDRLLEALG
jgi:predicted NUDIX family NTP pyrophosphohydrolase